MKSKLIFSPRTYGSHHPLMPPLGQAVIANFLRMHGHDVDQDDLDIKVHYDNWNSKSSINKINLQIFDDPNKVNPYLFKSEQNNYLSFVAEKMLNKTEHRGYDLFGFSLVDFIGYSVSSSTLALAKLLKEKYDIPILVGGLFDLQNAEFFIKSGYVDYCIIGYGEEGYGKLIESLEKSTTDLSDVPGLVYNYEGEIKANNQGRNQSKFPDFTGLPMELYRFDLAKYCPEIQLRPNGQIQVLPYYFMNGCPNKCIFCGQSTGNLPFSFKQPALICEELEALSEKYSTHYFCFLNTNLNFSKSFMLSLCDEIQRRNLDITWTDSANFKNMDDDIVKRLKTSGLNRILFGLESASPRMQQYIQKNIDIKKAEATLKEAHGNNIWNEVYLICGLPHETDEDINQTKDFIQRNQQHINFMHVNPFRLIYSALMQNQARFGIENVKPIADTSTNSSEYFTYSFDEKDGLRWNQKLQQIDNSFDTINSTIRGIKIMSSMKYSSSHLQLIYSLFSLFSSVDEVQSYYSQIQSIKQREKTMN